MSEHPFQLFIIIIQQHGLLVICPNEPLTHSVPRTVGPENDKMTKKVSGQNEYVHRVLRSYLSQKAPGRPNEDFFYHLSLEVRS